MLHKLEDGKGRVVEESSRSHREVKVFKVGLLQNKVGNVYS